MRLKSVSIIDSVERSEQIKGATLIPKKAVEVMEGEVDRLMVLIHNSIVPLPYIVPRRVSLIVLYFIAISSIVLCGIKSTSDRLNGSYIQLFHTIPLCYTQDGELYFKRVVILNSIIQLSYMVLWSNRLTVALVSQSVKH